MTAALVTASNLGADFDVGTRVGQKINISYAIAPTWSQTHTFAKSPQVPAPLSTDSSASAASTTWTKQFFPGLSTSVVGTGLPGLDMASGQRFFINQTATSAAQDTTLLAVQKTANYSGTASGGKAAMTVDCFVTGSAVGTFENGLNVTLTSFAPNGGFNVASNLIGVTKAINASNTWGALIACYDFIDYTPGSTRTFGDNSGAGQLQNSGGASLSKGRTGLEVDMYCEGPDPNYQRIGLEVVIGTPDGAVPTTPPTSTYGIVVSPVGADVRYGSFTNCISIRGTTHNTGLDMFQARFSGSAIISYGFIVDGGGNTTVNSLIGSNFGINNGGLGTFVSVKTGGLTLSTGGQIMSSGGNVYHDNPAVGGGFVLRSGAALTPLLTLDGAGNATFAGTLRVPSFTVATLPAAGAAGRAAHCSNARMFNGAGTLEATGAGTGGLVEDNGSAWKLPGTNQTVSA